MLQLLLFTKGQFTSCTMKSNHEKCPFPWSNLTVQHPWSHFLKNQFTKSLCPSLGVNQMWTERNDHASKVNVLIFSIYIPKKAILKKIKFDHSLVFSSPKNISLNIYYNIIPLSWALAFFYLTPLLSLPPQNPLDHVSG